MELRVLHYLLHLVGEGTEFYESGVEQLQITHSRRCRDSLPRWRMNLEPDFFAVVDEISH